jgi:hypothetical protein
VYDICTKSYKEASMLRDKIKGVLIFRGLKVSKYSERLGIKDASLSRKLKDEAFTISDLIKLAELTESHLCLVDEKDKSVILNFNTDI